MPSWLAITTLVVVFGGLLACGVYSLWTTQQIG